MWGEKLLKGKSVSEYVEILTKYRTPIMGLAILWIVLFHADVYLYDIVVLNFVKECGYGGVDIFFFLSGMGLYFSLEKDGDIVKFYSRRLLRLAPTYVPFILAWSAVELARAGGGLQNLVVTIKQLFGNLVMTGWINLEAHQFNWYVQALFWFYILAPIFFALIQKASKSKGWIWIYLLILCVILIMSTNFWGKYTLLAATRLPLFVMGMMIVEIARRKEEVRIHPCIIYGFMIVGIAALYIIMKDYEQYIGHYGLLWYPFILITPGLCLLLSKCYELLDKFKGTKWLVTVSKHLGICSFEIYLLHIVIFANFRLKGFGNKYWLFLILVSIIAGVLYNWVVNKVLALIKTGRLKKERV